MITNQQNIKEKLRMKKHIFVMGLMLLFIIVINVNTVYAGTITAQGKCGDNVQWSLDDTGTLTISGYGSTYDYPYSGNSDIALHSYRVKHIIVNDKVMHLGDHLFSFLDYVTDVRIQSNCSLGVGVFANMGNSGSGYQITIPSSITELPKDTFYTSTPISVVLPDTITIIGPSSFGWCNNLTSIKIPANCEQIQNSAFNYCRWLDDVVIPASVKKLEFCAFSNCTAMTNITFVGDAPEIDPYAFRWTTTTAYYPANNKTWTPDKLQDYGGTITWIPTGEVEDEDDHEKEKTEQTLDYMIHFEADGHTYEIYQVFTGNYHKLDGQDVLTNVAWGSNAASPSANIEEVLEYLKENELTDNEIASYIANFVDFSTKPFATINDTTDINTPSGYYLIKDADDTIENDDAYTLYILVVSGNTTVKPKRSVPTVEKKVLDINETTGELSDWQDSADWPIDGLIPYRITAQLPSLEHYDRYYIEFVDTLSPGLSYEGDPKISIDGTTRTDKFDITYDNHVISFKCDDVKAIGATSYSIIQIDYVAKLNNNAVTGSGGNPNEVYLKYSNNPNASGYGMTTPDKVVVFTYQLNINKVKPDLTPLVGAAFELQKNKNGEWISLGEIETEESTIFSWRGLDDGEYRIIERKTPVGYNSIEAITFVIHATHTENSETPQLLTLTGNEKIGDIEAGQLSIDVINQPGVVLPSTGGNGIFGYYFIGIILILGTGITFYLKMA